MWGPSAKQDGRGGLFLSRKRPNTMWTGSVWQISPLIRILLALRREPSDKRANLFLPPVLVLFRIGPLRTYSAPYRYLLEVVTSLLPSLRHPNGSEQPIVISCGSLAIANGKSESI